MAVTAFPWAALPVVAREERIAVAWIAALAVRAGGVLGGLAWRGAWHEAGPDDVGPDAVVIEVRRGADRGWVAVPARIARALADVALDRPAELAAPRPVTPVERALAALAIADAIAAVVPDAEVEAIAAVPPAVAPRAIVAIAIARPIAGALRAIVPPALLAGLRAPPAPLTSIDALLALGEARLPPVACAVEVARADVAPARLAGLARGDVVVVGPAAPCLRIARGSIATTLDPANGTTTVAGPYLRDPTMTRDAGRETLTDDMLLPLTIVVGEIKLSARELFGLAPGRTLSLGQPPGSPVELRAGGQVIGHGELVVVDGDLGVRLTDVLSGAPSA